MDRPWKNPPQGTFALTYFSSGDFTFQSNHMSLWLSGENIDIYRVIGHSEGSVRAPSNMGGLREDSPTIFQNG
jgi:hypothetical protein